MRHGYPQKMPLSAAWRFQSQPKVSWSRVSDRVGLFAGPITSMLINSLGCRVVTMAGGVTTCVALILATFAPNVDVLILTYGVLGGGYDALRTYCHYIGPTADWRVLRAIERNKRTRPQQRRSQVGKNKICVLLSGACTKKLEQRVYLKKQ